MPWVKGMPRKGHVNKDGKPHGSIGRKPKQSIHISIEATPRTNSLSKPTTVSTLSKATDGSASGVTMTSRGSTTSSGRQAAGNPSALRKDTSVKKTRKYSTKLAHSQYSIEPCPNCLFPEADGGYCPECGWTRPVDRLPANSVHGRTFKR